MHRSKFPIFSWTIAPHEKVLRGGTSDLRIVFYSLSRRRVSYSLSPNAAPDSQDSEDAGKEPMIPRLGAVEAAAVNSTNPQAETAAQAAAPPRSEGYTSEAPFSECKGLLARMLPSAKPPLFASFFKSSLFDGLMTHVRDYVILFLQYQRAVKAAGVKVGLEHLKRIYIDQLVRKSERERLRELAKPTLKQTNNTNTNANGSVGDSSQLQECRNDGKNGNANIHGLAKSIGAVEPLAIELKLLERELGIHYSRVLERYGGSMNFAEERKFYKFFYMSIGFYIIILVDPDERKVVRSQLESLFHASFFPAAKPKPGLRAQPTSESLDKVFTNSNNVTASTILSGSGGNSEPSAANSAGAGGAPGAAGSAAAGSASILASLASNSNYGAGQLSGQGNSGLASVALAALALSGAGPSIAGRRASAVGPRSGMRAPFKTNVILPPPIDENGADDGAFSIHSKPESGPVSSILQGSHGGPSGVASAKTKAEGDDGDGKPRREDAPGRRQSLSVLMRRAVTHNRFEKKLLKDRDEILKGETSSRPSEAFSLKGILNSRSKLVAHLQPSKEVLRSRIIESTRFNNESFNKGHKKQLLFHTSSRKTRQPSGSRREKSFSKSESGGIYSSAQEKRAADGNEHGIKSRTTTPLIHSTASDFESSSGFCNTSGASRASDVVKRVLTLKNSEASISDRNGASQSTVANGLKSATDGVASGLSSKRDSLGDTRRLNEENAVLAAAAKSAAVKSLYTSEDYLARFEKLSLENLVTRLK